jgi:hypothetical protein
MLQLSSADELHDVFLVIHPSDGKIIAHIGPFLVVFYVLWDPLVMAAQWMSWIH